MLRGESTAKLKEKHQRNPIEHKSEYPICKDVLGLLPKPLYLSLLHIVVNMNVLPLRASFNGPKA
jgi:hypothetical protein